MLRLLCSSVLCCMVDHKWRCVEKPKFVGKKKKKKFTLAIKKSSEERRHIWKTHRILVLRSHCTSWIQIYFASYQEQQFDKKASEDETELNTLPTTVPYCCTVVENIHNNNRHSSRICTLRRKLISLFTAICLNPWSSK